MKRTISEATKPISSYNEDHSEYVTDVVKLRSIWGRIKISHLIHTTPVQIFVIECAPKAHAD